MQRSDHPLNYHTRSVSENFQSCNIYLPDNSDTNFERGASIDFAFRFFVLFLFFFFTYQSSYENGILVFSSFGTNERLCNCRRAYNKFSHAKNSAFESRFRRPSTIRRDIVKLLVYWRGKFSYLNFYPTELYWRKNNWRKSIGRDARNFRSLRFLSKNYETSPYPNSCERTLFHSFSLNFNSNLSIINSINRGNRGRKNEKRDDETKVLFVSRSHLESVEAAPRDAKILRISIYFACLRVAQCGRPV